MYISFADLEIIFLGQSWKFYVFFCPLNIVIGTALKILWSEQPFKCCDRRTYKSGTAVGNFVILSGFNIFHSDNLGNLHFFNPWKLVTDNCNSNSPSIIVIGGQPEGGQPQLSNFTTTSILSEFGLLFVATILEILHTFLVLERF